MTYIQLANPKRIKAVNTKKDYIEFIKANNGLTNLYHTVFRFKYLERTNKPNYESAIINQMFFDMDTKRSLEACKIFTEYLDKENLKYYLKQSSFDKFPKLQVYVATKICDLNNKKNALFNSMVHLCKQTKLTFGDAHSCDIDKSTFGDLTQLCPISGTYKPKRKSFCSYISKEDLNDIEILKERALKGNGKLVIYGNKEFDMKPFDRIVDNEFNCCNHIIENDDFDIKFEDKFVDGLPPLIKKILSNYNNYCDNYKNRWRCALFMRDIGYPESLTEQILQKYFSKVLNFTSLDGRGTQWDRFVKCKGLHYTYHGAFAAFPNVETLLEEGLEITKEDKDAVGKLYG